ncbi:hypothetical protein EYR38_001808 [Pleurotus pulmonarius]|nr:hypothetical protein EYR38_001808 [Pleurotus pulmonarius]
MAVKEDGHKEDTEAAATEFFSGADMNGEDDQSNAKAAVVVDEDNTMGGRLNTSIGEEVNDRCDGESRHAELSTSTSKGIESERIDSGTKPSEALLNIMNDDKMETWTKLKRMAEEDKSVLQWRVGGPVEYRDKGNERECPRPKPPARLQLLQHKLGKHEEPQLGEPSRPGHSRLLQLLHPQWRTRKKE